MMPEQDKKRQLVSAISVVIFIWLAVAQVVPAASHAVYPLIVLLIAFLSIVSRKLRKRVKAEMEHGLGREVADYELTSISTWMRIPEHAKTAGAEAEKFQYQ